MTVYRIKKETTPPPQETQEVEAINPLPAQLEGLEPVNKLSPELREAVARAVLIDGKTGRDVAREYGIGKNAVTSCVREFFAEFVDQRNMALVGKLDVVTEELLQRIRENVHNLPLQQLVVSFGILMDKRKDLISKVAPPPGTISLRIAWQDGSGAVELTTGPAATNPAAPGPGNHDPAPILRVKAGEEQDNQGGGAGEVIDIEASPVLDPVASPQPDAAVNEDDPW